MLACFGFHDDVGASSKQRVSVCAGGFTGAVIREHSAECFGPAERCIEGDERAVITVRESADSVGGALLAALDDLRQAKATVRELAFCDRDILRIHGAIHANDSVRTGHSPEITGGRQPPRYSSCMEKRDPGTPGTTCMARLMMSLESVLFEIGKMDREMVDAGAADVDASTRREVRRRLAGLSTDANHLMTWLSEARLETPIN